MATPALSELITRIELYLEQNVKHVLDEQNKMLRSMLWQQSMLIKDREKITDLKMPIVPLSSDRVSHDLTSSDSRYETSRSSDSRKLTSASSCCGRSSTILVNEGRMGSPSHFSYRTTTIDELNDEMPKDGVRIRSVASAVLERTLGPFEESVKPAASDSEIVHGPVGLTGSATDLDDDVKSMELFRQKQRISYRTNTTATASNWNFRRTTFSSVSSVSAGKAGYTILFGNMRAMLLDDTMDTYDVSDYYKDGFLRDVITGTLFNCVVMIVVCINGVYIGLEADWNKHAQNEDLVYTLSDHFFCAFFTLELMLRFLIFAHKFNCLRDFWFKFDALLVLFMIGETWLLPLLTHLLGGSLASLRGGSLLRLFRLLRLSRIARILRVLPELVTMVKGIIVGCRAVASALFLLIIIIYVFAIAMFSLIGTEDGFNDFSNLRKSMLSLLLYGVLLDNVSKLATSLINSEHVVAVCCFFCFVIIAALTVMNMLIGVIVEVVSEVAAAEKENAARSQIKHTLLVMLKEMDSNHTGALDRDEVIHAIMRDSVLRELDSLEVSPAYLLDILTMILEHRDQVKISVIIDVVLSLRGNRSPTVSDISQHHNSMYWLIQVEMERVKQLIREELPRLRSPSRSPRSIRSPHFVHL